MEIVLFEMTKVHFPNILKSSYAMYIYVNSFFLSLDNLNMEKKKLNENMNKQIKRDTVRPLFVKRYLLKFQGVKKTNIWVKDLLICHCIGEVSWWFKRSRSNLNSVIFVYSS